MKPMQKNSRMFLIICLAVFYFVPLYCQTKTKNIEIILDASGSMNDTFDKREKKIDIAKKTILKILSELSSDATSQIKIGLRTFGEDRE
ncbi:MAG: hypothetical protein COS68_01120, partial [Elusimicrobia bacterium CG06_land_8_20_14_3_00_38_11]